jgi:apyrase
MPRQADFEQAPVNLAPTTTSTTEVKASGVASEYKYCIVFDAGSTGSRIHVYKFKATDSGLQLISDTFDQLKPGLSSYADDPAKAAESLTPLMAKAFETVPKELQVRVCRASSQQH